MLHEIKMANEMNIFFSISSRKLHKNYPINQSIHQYSFIWWHDITTDINAIAIYIADLECSKAKYPECPADNDIYRA